MDVMIDLETLGVNPNAPILQIGAVAFDPHTDYVETDIVFDVYVIPDKETTMDMSTFIWWLGQSDDAKGNLHHGLRYQPLTERLALECLSSWIKDDWDNIRCVWSHGIGFDISLLKNAFHRHDITPPWHFRHERDTRTLFDIIGNTPKVIKDDAMVAHNALHDAIYQARQVQAAYKLLSNVEWD